MSLLREQAEQALEDARTARQDITAEEGIGSELPPTIYAWTNTGTLIGTACIEQQINDLVTHQTNILAGIRVIREGWQANTIALITEAYTTNTPDPTKTLEQRFATDPEVHECITAMLVNDEGEAIIGVQPFTAELGRTINWHEPQLNEIQATDNTNTNLIYATLVTTPEHPTNPERTPQLAAETLLHIGFDIIAYFGPNS